MFVCFCSYNISNHLHIIKRANGHVFGNGGLGLEEDALSVSLVNITDSFTFSGGPACGPLACEFKIIFVTLFSAADTGERFQCSLRH